VTQLVHAPPRLESISDVAERMYAGTLGKLIGVYFGRPVEGWSYQEIRERFGTIDYFVAQRLGVPLIVPDDDVSGTFVFFRALEDNPGAGAVDARTVGNTWLNYIVENKTVLWWGGLSRSTEHTAYLRLKAGIAAPRSGSIELNGRAMAEQIGAQIFIDAWAMASPGDPERAVAMAREAASVSHDGLAVEAACFLAAMEALAFVEPELNVLIATGLELVPGARLHRLVEDVANVCSRTADWRSVRDWIETNQTVLGERLFDYAIDDTYELEFQLEGRELRLLIDGQPWIQAVDATYTDGGAGFVVHRGAILADGFRVRAL
jgi:hypothetical protein